MRILPLLAVNVFLLLSFPVHAREVSAPSSDCVMNEEANLSVNFNGISETATDVQPQMKKEWDTINGYAQEIGISPLTAQSQSYNIYTQMNNNRISGYNYNASATYQIKDAAKAIKLMEKLTEKGIQTSINVNSYHNGNCK